jgi:anion-transporting  ArsA/GET3 family ATPase
LQTFVAAFDTLFGGFRQRAQKTYALLQASGTAFLVVAAPEPDAMREAAYFVERLKAERMPFAGLVVNRATAAPQTDLSREQALAAAERLGTSGLTAGLLRLHAERVSAVERERRALLRRRPNVTSWRNLLETAMADHVAAVSVASATA